MASRRPWHPSPGNAHREGGGQSGNVSLIVLASGVSHAARLAAWNVIMFEPMHKHPGDDPWDESGLQALCRGCHIQKTRLERITPTTQDQKDWLNFTSKPL